MERYYLMNKDIILGIVTKEGEHFEFERNKDVDRAILFPYDFYQLNDKNLIKKCNLIQ